MPAKLGEKELVRVNIMVPPEWLDRVNEWRGRQPGVPNLSAAIRDIVDEKVEETRPTKRAKAARAAR